MSTVPLTSPAEASVEHALAAVRRGRFRPETAWAVACLALDAVMLAGATVASGIGAERAGAGAMPARWALAFTAAAIGLSAIRGLYRLQLRLRVIDDLGRVVTATAIAGMGVLSIRLLLGEESTVATETVRLTVFATAYVGAGRVALALAAPNFLRTRSLGRPTLIVGAGKVGHLLARRLLERPETGLRPVAFLDADPLPSPSGSPALPVVSSGWSIDEAVERYGIRQVVLTFAAAPSEVFLRIVKRANELGLGVSIVPRLFDRLPDRVDLDRLGGLPMLTVRPSDPRGLQYSIKYVLDPLAAALMLLLLSPVLLLAALAVWLESGRPILFRQTRVGRDGRRFEMLKFRSMDADEGDGEPFRLPSGAAPGGVEGADRRTRVGTLLRRTSIDEFPQLLNVFRREMSLVGPRPERPEFVSEFERQVYRYDERHRVKAGMTGWAQVHGLRGQTSIADRAEWDNYYIENFSLWLDLKILLMTVGAVVRSARE